MGRGRAKAKQTKVARQLKYNSGGTDLESLRRELIGEDTEDRTDEPTDGYDDLLPGVLHGDDRIQTLVQLDALFGQLVRVAGFEPELADAEHGHTIAAYRRPIAT